MQTSAQECPLRENVPKRGGGSRVCRQQRVGISLSPCQIKVPVRVITVGALVLQTGVRHASNGCGCGGMHAPRDLHGKFDLRSQ